MCLWVGVFESTEYMWEYREIIRVTQDMPYNSSLKWMRIYKFYMLGLWCSFLTMGFEQGTFIEGNIYINKTRGWEVRLRFESSCPPKTFK